MSGSHRSLQPTVFMMDLWATVPYYTAYLSRALLAVGVPVQVGAITYYLDRKCFAGRGLKLDPGCSDLVGHLNLPRSVRRAAKLLEGALNLLTLAVRFGVRPPEIVHVQFLPLLRSRLAMDLWFVRLCQRRGSKLVLTVHDLLPHDTGQVHLETYRRLYAEMDALICHSEVIRTRLQQEFHVPEAKISVIPHGPFFFDLPSSTEEGKDTDATSSLVLWQGIIFPYKGVDLLLEAWARVESQTDRLRLKVLGTGEPGLLQSLQQQATNLGLRRVEFDLRFCSTEELVATYREAAVVVYPYRAITTSGALATGLALKKAIVASRLPVFEEVLVDGQNALLVDPVDPAELAAAVVRAALEPGMAERLSYAVAALQFGEQSWRLIAEKTEAVYERVLSERATAGAEGATGFP